MDRARRASGSRAASLVAAGLVAATLVPVPVGAQGPGGAVEAGVVEGVVVGEAGGEAGGEASGVRGALVRVVPGGGSGVVTDREGRFRLSGVAAGEVRLRVEAAGYRTVERTVSAAERGSPVVIVLEIEPVALGGVVATATPLRGGASYQPARALDREALQRRAAVSVGQVLDGEPGVAMRSFGPAPARPVIRGLDGDRIAVLENGQRMGDISETAPDHAIALDPLTADGVEVVRGPASLLYGSSALGGVVNVLREDVLRSWVPGVQGSAAVQGATVNREGAVAVRGLMGGERWAGAGRFGYRGGGDFRTPGAGDGLLTGTHSRRLTAGAGLGYSGDALRGGLSVDVMDHDFGVPEEMEDPAEEVELRSGRQRLAGELTWNREGVWDRVEVRAAGTRFVQREVEIERRAAGVVEGIEHEFTRRTYGATLTAGHRSIGPVGEGALGLSALVQTLLATGAAEFHPNARSVSAAAFLFEEVPLTDALRLQVGARLEAQRMHALPNAAFPDLRDERTAVTLSGSVGANVRPAPGVEVGAQLARAHRAPLVEELYSEGAHLGTGRYEIGNPELPNEIGYGADLFARYTGDRVGAELAAFVNRIDNYVILRSMEEDHPVTGVPIHMYEPDAAELRGGEAVVEIRATPRTTLRGVADFVRGSRLDADRTPLPYMPPARAMVEAEYDAGGWWLGGRSRTAAAQRRVAHETPTDGYTLVDLQAGLRLPGGSRDHVLAVRLDNAFDIAYRDHLSRVEDRRFPMPGRNLSVSYRWQF